MILDVSILNEITIFKSMVITTFILFPNSRSLKNIKGRYLQLIHGLLLWGQGNSNVKDYEIRLEEIELQKLYYLQRALKARMLTILKCLREYWTEFNFWS